MVGFSGQLQPHVIVVIGLVAVVGMFGAPLLLLVCRWTLKETLIG
jgi:hypothetical protein